MEIKVIYTINIIASKGNAFYNDRETLKEVHRKLDYLEGQKDSFVILWK